jgi:hypothetical protein
VVENVDDGGLAKEDGSIPLRYNITILGSNYEAGGGVHSDLITLQAGQT